MQSIKSAVASTAEAWEKIDVAALRARATQLQTAGKEVVDAQSGARERIRLIDVQISRRRQGPDAELAAEAVLSGAPVLTAELTVEQLQDEKSALLAARTGLQHRHTDLRSDAQAFGREVTVELANGSEGLIKALREQAEHAIAELELSCRMIRSFTAWVKTSELRDMSDRLHDAMQAVRPGARLAERPLPDHLTELLAEFKSLFELQDIRLPERRRF